MRFRSVRTRAHPVLPWAWAGCAIALVISGRARSEFAPSLALITASVLIFFSTSIPQYRRRIFYLGSSLATFAIAIRMFIATLIGVPMPGSTLFTLPEITLPTFIVGIRLGGPVTSDRLLSALTESLVFAAIVISLSLANSIHPPHALLRALPNRLYGFGVATSIATSVTPQTASSISRVSHALRLRGDTSSGLARARRLLTPVLEESLERSIDLASALEVRGYGRGIKATRYRSHKWSFADSLSLIAIALVVITLPVLQLSPLGEFLLILIAFVMVKLA